MAEIVVDAEGRKIYGATNELVKEAKEKGVCPCGICKKVENPDKCAATGCYAYYVWFAEKWQNIKEAARRKGYKV